MPRIISQVGGKSILCSVVAKPDGKWHAIAAYGLRAMASGDIALNGSLPDTIVCTEANTAALNTIPAANAIILDGKEQIRKNVEAAT